MSHKKKQYYVVVTGRTPGVYQEWFGVGGAATQVEDFPEAIYRGFYTREEAVAWLRELGEEIFLKVAPEWAETPELLGPLPQEQIEDLLKAGKVVLHTDGCALTNPGPGGYAVILRYQAHQKQIAGGFRLTTNNRMEIKACIEGLQALKQRRSVVLYSDSRYVVENMANGYVKKWAASGWKKSDQKHLVENVDLWEQLLKLCDQYEVEFLWTRGHVGNKDNERCDQLAAAAARSPNLPADEGYETSETHGGLPLFSSTESK